MFLQHWLWALVGWVEWKAEGGFPERFLNLAAGQDIPLLRARRQGIALLGGCYARHYRRLRPLARRSGIRLRVTRRHGLPFYLRRYRRHAGLAVGAVLAALLLRLLSGSVWVVDVSGNETVPDERIIAVARELGVDVGVHRNAIDLRDIQLQAIQKLPELSWIGVNVEGCVAHIEVNERIVAEEPPDQSHPTNLKAARDGRIVATRVAQGALAVKPGDAVYQGMLLVSGIVETGGGTLFKHARGEVIARTEREFTVTVPFEETLPLPGDEVIFRPTFQFFSLNIPLYTNTALPQEVDLQTREYPLTAAGVRLPIALIHRYYRPVVPTPVRRTEEQARALAEQRVAEWKSEQLGAATILKEEKNGSVTADGYRFTVRCICEENIAVEEPILISFDNSIE